MCDLQGLGILVTRPAHQADGLCELIEKAHGRPIRFPALEIAGPADPQAAKAVLRGVRGDDLLIFVSANAVEHAFPLLPDTLPGDLAIAAVGGATARKLEEMGLDPTLVPADRFDSEGLLALPALQSVAGRRVFILRGNGGRALLGDTLTERGADVRYVEVYQRLRPRRSGASLLKNWEQMVELVVATSNEILDNLFAMLGDEGGALLRATPLLVVSERMAAHAEELGVEQLVVAESASDAAVIKSICGIAG